MSSSRLSVVKCEEEWPPSEVELLQEVSRGRQADEQQREFADEGGGGFKSTHFHLPVFFMHFQGEASKLKKFKTGLGRRLNDIVGDMQDIRDEGLHSLNELKVEYQVSPISSSELKVIISQKSLSENGVKGSSIPVSICIGEISICNVGIRWKSGK